MRCKGLELGFRELFRNDSGGRGSPSKGAKAASLQETEMSDLLWSSRVAAACTCGGNCRPESNAIQVQGSEAEHHLLEAGVH